MRRSDMRTPWLSAAIFLALLTPALAAHRAAPAPTGYVPPAEPGNIFTVIDFARVRGTNQPTYVTVILGGQRRDLVVVPPYRNCVETTPAGIVLRTRHSTSDATPLTLTTTGTIIRGPYQGDLPLEVLHPCYKLVN
jgi:hypothetical protein